MRHAHLKYCIAGIGGAGRETLLCLKDYIKANDLDPVHPIYFMVDDASFKQHRIMGIEVIKQSDFDPSQFQVVVAIGNPLKRKEVVDGLPHNTKFTTIIHPTAIVSEYADIGDGSIITAGVVITCNVKIGKHSQFNLNSTIGHDCVLGDFFTSGQGVNISGNCTIGDEVYLGSNSCVKQGTRIGDKVLVGMGGVVIKDLLNEGTYVGNPVVQLNK